MVSQSIDIGKMIIYILRHGEAEAKSSQKMDEERRLTSFGKSQLRKSLVIAKEIGTRVDLILSSPLVRARETAEIAKEIFNVEKFEIDDRFFGALFDPDEQIKEYNADYITDNACKRQPSPVLTFVENQDERR